MAPPEKTLVEIGQINTFVAFATSQFLTVEADFGYALMTYLA